VREGVFNSRCKHYFEGRQAKTEKDRTDSQRKISPLLSNGYKQNAYFRLYEYIDKPLQHCVEDKDNPRTRCSLSSLEDLLKEIDFDSQELVS
jgi:hypothetical protein